MAKKILHNVSVKGQDVRSYTDELRAKYPIVKNTSHEWVLLKHEDVNFAALNDESFSNNASRYLQIPNGLDGEEHTRYRKIIDKYLTRQALIPYIPVFENIAKQLVKDLPKGAILDAVNDIGAVFAVRAQSKWLGWPKNLETTLLAWMKENHAATRSGDHAWTSSVAEKFDDIVQTIIQSRRHSANKLNNSSAIDVTAQLCNEKVDGRLLTESELVSILRNWTGGDLGSIALCVGVIIAYIAEHPELIDHIRKASNNEVEDIINEILRIDNPFVSNRRITTCPVKIAGQSIPKGARVKLHWTSANRDESVFNNNQFDPKKNADKNLVYGIGKHACPGRLLASWQLRIALQTLLANIDNIALISEQMPEREVAPVGGYHRVPVIFT
ncbi:cytochrome P450 [Thalassotalea profundi]|uniref:Cytochrome P450 n=1 Tax=Thalassotalea profundi TaxID=2036687 RepID=A0ABQ3IPI9_9GAMM|nr:cytochrome P450 [Thalassotalea profundi]GHE87288.1 cytochrome P450 [Thalassotalea profundi]